MQAGHELENDLFFQKELKSKIYRLIQFRWAVVVLFFLGNGTAHLLNLQLPTLYLNSVAAFIVFYNTIFLVAWRRITDAEPRHAGPVAQFAHIQIALDLLALYLVIFFTGGIHSPFLMFVIFHIIMAGFFLSALSCFAYGIAFSVALGALVVFQKESIFSFCLTVPPYVFELSGMFILCLAFIVAILISALLVTSIKTSFRDRGRELLDISRNLDVSNAKLTALYEMVKEMALSGELQELLNSATKNASRIMGVKACSIKLLDEEKKSLRFASTYGLSEDYLSKGSIDIEKSPINLKVVRGQPYAIGQIEEEDFFLFPEDIKKEGIASIICLPLSVNEKVLGVFCVYSRQSYYFTEEDVQFFSLMTNLTSLAIENLRSGLTKSWFMLKAAHQLRSPLNAVYSMLKVAHDGYLGKIDAKLQDTFLRCQKRLEIISYLINDMLILGGKRSEASKRVFYPVDIARIVIQTVELYHAKASEKGLQLQHEVAPTIPNISANEKIIDELLSNLISNAVKYTPPGGTIKVILSQEGPDRLKLEVADTGIGIAEEDKKLLFTEFFRAESAKALVEEGTGLGLVIAKEIMDSIGGTIRVESEVGRGTRFICSFSVRENGLEIDNTWLGEKQR